MDKDRFKLIVILVALILLEIPVFWLWSRVSDGVSLSRPEETVAVTEAAPAQTLPAVTEPPQTHPPETAPTETVPPETEPSVITIDAVPQYDLNDYPDEPYGTGTVASSGSNMTALAMVASFMTDHSFYPDQMADWLAHFIGSHWQRLEYGSDLLQLKWHRAENIHESLRAVREGKVVILLMNSKSMFSWKDHYIVLTGVNAAGKYTVMDTDAKNYEKGWLGQYYVDGFSDKDLLRGYSCGWIYDKSAMPDEPFVYAPEPAPAESRYPGLELTAEEKRLLANLICMEAGGEPFEGQQAVAEVVLNRLASGRFQSTIHNIVHAPEQFAAVPYLYMAEPDYTQYKAIEQAQYGPYVLPEDVVFYAKFKVNDKVWGKIGNHYFCHAY